MCFARGSCPSVASPTILVGRLVCFVPDGAPLNSSTEYWCVRAGLCPSAANPQYSWDAWCVLYPTAPPYTYSSSYLPSCHDGVWTCCNGSNWGYPDQVRSRSVRSAHAGASCTDHARDALSPLARLQRKSSGIAGFGQSAPSMPVSSALLTLSTQPSSFSAFATRVISGPVQDPLVTLVTQPSSFSALQRKSSAVLFRILAHEVKPLGTFFCSSWFVRIDPHTVRAGLGHPH